MNSYSYLARLYDGFMNDVDYSAWAYYIARLLKHAMGIDQNNPFLRPVRILECGCGTGNITLPLSKLGFDVTASDISDEMLAVAAEKSRKAGMRIPFVRMDMKKLAFHRPLDGIIACCDCVNYLTGADEAAEFFHCAYAHLKPGGVLLFDISSKFKLENVLGNNAFTDSNDETVYFWQNTFDAENALIEMKLEFFSRVAASSNEEGLYKRSSETHIQRAHSEKELVSKLDEAGFSIISVFGAFGFEPPEPDCERIQFLAVK